MAFHDDGKRLCLLTTVDRLCGRNARDRVWQALGGRRFYVPSKAKPHSVLLTALGAAGDRAVREELGGCSIDVPKFGHAERLRSITDMVRDGRPRWQIARALGLSTRHVCRLIADLRAAGELPPRKGPC